MYLATRNPLYSSAARFWTRVFAVNFAMGVATGIVMEFEFGTNWAAYSRFVGDVFGSALAAEGVFAFFLESGFLALLVFGWDRVSAGMHFFATVMVFLGSVFSSVWIVVANSWMQTPAGHHVVESALGVRAEIVDFWAMVFNPASVARLLHVWVGALILGGFFVTSIAAWYLLKGRHAEFARLSLRVGLVVAAVGSFAALFTGHLQADLVADHQPAKLAAFEGHWVTGPADLYLFGRTDDGEARTHGLALPGGLSFVVHGDFAAPVPGLDQVDPADRPNVAMVFQTYHAMVGLGMFFILLSVVALAWWARGRLFETRWLLWIFVFTVLAAHAANQLGWVSAEAGRQPWIVYGLMRTSDALSESVGAEAVLSSIILFGLIYAMLFAVWLFVLNDKIQHGPEPAPAGGDSTMRDVVSRRRQGGRFSLTGFSRRED
jgi:cytochrome d ubiquinol oxidase subunit I